jgi:CheY-like chemotaxis protein
MALNDTVLLVEDSEDDVMFMQRAFAKAQVPYALKTVADGREAIAYLAGNEIYSCRGAFPIPRLVLLDLNLPHVSGFDVLRWIRQQTAYLDLIVVVLSSSELPSDIRQAYALGANSFLSKPADPNKLTDLVRDLAQRWLREPN